MHVLTSKAPVPTFSPVGYPHALLAFAFISASSISRAQINESVRVTCHACTARARTMLQAFLDIDIGDSLAHKQQLDAFTTGRQFFEAVGNQVRIRQTELHRHIKPVCSFDDR